MTTNVAPPDSSIWVPVVGEQGYQFLLDLYRRTGETDDFVANQDVQEFYPWPQDSRYCDYDLIVISTDYTTAGNQVIIATNGETVTLNATPEDNETVIVKRDSTSDITVSGTIDGDSSHVITQNYAAIALKYSTEQAKWYIV